MTEQELLKMKLHQIVIIIKDFIWIMRVAGGWIYYFQQSIKRDPVHPSAHPATIDVSIATTFVPEIKHPSPDLSYLEWLDSQGIEYPEPEPDQELTDDERLLTLGHY